MPCPSWLLCTVHLFKRLKCCKDLTRVTLSFTVIQSALIIYHWYVTKKNRIWSTTIFCRRLADSFIRSVWQTKKQCPRQSFMCLPSFNSAINSFRLIRWGPRCTFVHVILLLEELDTNLWAVTVYLHSWYIFRLSQRSINKALCLSGLIIVFAKLFANYALLNINNFTQQTFRK